VFGHLRPVQREWSDEIWKEAARQYDEPVLAALILSVASLNLWNCLSATTREVAGEWAKSAEARGVGGKSQIPNVFREYVSGFFEPAASHLPRLLLRRAYTEGGSP
jgi:hypothetical protein